jgi:hypothetical protein
MNVIGEEDFRNAVIGTKKDAKLVAAGKNDRTASAETMYGEFKKLSVDRQREIIVSIASDNFVAALWKIAYPLNNLPAAVVPVVMPAIGKVLFYSHEELALREAIRSVKIYMTTPFLKQICAGMQDAAELAGEKLSEVLKIINSPDIFGLIKTLPSAPATEKLVTAICRIAGYTRNLDSTRRVVQFLFARRDSERLEDLVNVVENSLFMARDKKSVRAILDGFTRGSVDVVLHREAGQKGILSSISDLAWKTKDAEAIRNYLAAYLRQ